MQHNEDLRASSFRMKGWENVQSGEESCGDRTENSKAKCSRQSKRFLSDTEELRDWFSTSSEVNTSRREIPNCYQNQYKQHNHTIILAKAQEGWPNRNFTYLRKPGIFINNCIYERRNQYFAGMNELTFVPNVRTSNRPAASPLLSPSYLSISHKRLSVCQRQYLRVELLARSHGSAPWCN